MIRDLHEKLVSKKISSVELTKHYLNRAKSDTTNSYITLSEDVALAQAKAADERIAKGARVGLLTGIPLGIKDVLCTKGVRTTCGSKILGDYKPPYNATSVQKLDDAGAVMIGKLNMDEFAMGGSNENSSFGPVKNPVDPSRVAGGSSGGSAAAVKAGLAVATLGTDTGGSVRLPGSFCGIPAMKPTYGTVSRYGLVAFSSSLDQVGPMGVTVEDNAIMLSAIAGRDDHDSTTWENPKFGTDFVAQMNAEKGKKYRIGIPKEYFVGGLQKEVAESIDKVKVELTKAGHTFVEISLPHTQAAVAVYYIVAVSEASSNLSRFDGVRFGARQGGNLSLHDMYKKTRSLFGDEVKRRIVLGTFALSAGYYDAYFKKACQVRRLIANDFTAAFGQVDAILAPTAPTTAYKLGDKTADPLTMYLYDIFTIPVNLAGLCGISVPAGRDAGNLPVGVQFIAPRFEDRRVFALAREVEERVYRDKTDHGF